MNCQRSNYNIMRKTLVLACAMMLFSCRAPQGNGTADTASDASSEGVMVKADSGNDSQADAEYTPNRIVSKGVIESVSEIAVYCPLQEQVLRLNVSDGMHVNRGQVLLELNDENLLNSLTQARNEFEQAEFQYEEILIGQGYRRDSFEDVPENVVKMARVKSGYNISETALRQAENRYAKRIVTAPVSGIVTDVSVHQYDIPGGSEPLCRIFDGEHLKVVFNILEVERAGIAIDREVSVSTMAFAGETHRAVISLISPKVDANGMLRVEAVIEDNVNLIPGMTAFVNL